MPQKATLIGGYFLRLVLGIKITHPLSVLQPKVIVFTKGYLKRHNNKENNRPGNCLCHIFSFTFQLPRKKQSYYLPPFVSVGFLIVTYGMEKFNIYYENFSVTF